MVFDSDLDGTSIANDVVERVYVESGQRYQHSAEMDEQAVFISTNCHVLSGRQKDYARGLVADYRLNGGLSEWESRYWDRVIREIKIRLSPV